MQSDCVCLLHGITKTAKTMVPFSNFLCEQPVKVINMEYPTTAGGLVDLAEIIYLRYHRELISAQRLHFVGHSLGGLLARRILDSYSDLRIASLVLWGAPNHGSEVARYFSRCALFKKRYVKSYGAAGLEMADRQRLYQLMPSSIQVPCMIIAGNQHFCPWYSWMFQGEHDGKVSLQSTRLNGMAQWSVAPSTHVGLTRSQWVFETTWAFIRAQIAVYTQESSNHRVAD